MDFVAKDLIGVATVIIAFATLWTTSQVRKDKGTKELIAQAELRALQSMQNTKAELEMRVAQANAACAEHAAELAQLRLDLVTLQSKTSTRDDLDQAITRALAPLREQVTRSTNFIEEILRSGVLRPKA